MGQRVPVNELVRTVAGITPAVDGLTISGGEPLQQSRAVLTFLHELREEFPMPVILFSGYTWHEIRAMPLAKELPQVVDVLIAGRYISALNVGHHLVGSANKTFHFFSQRYSREDFDPVPEAELIILPDGEIVASGINPFKAS